MNPIAERQLRINESRYGLDEEKWLTNMPLAKYSSAKFGKTVVKGPPQATEEHTTKDLIEQGLIIGVYER